MADPQHREILRLRTQLSQEETQHWLEDSFLHWHWWAELIVIVGFWYVWWLMVDKKRIVQVFSYALAIALINCLTDAAMANVGWFAYPHRLLPIWSGYIMGDITVPSVVYSLIYQKYQKWRSFILATVIASAFFAFIGEPILIWMGTYELYKWKIIYSFPMYLIIVIIPKWLIDLMVKKSTDNSNVHTPLTKYKLPK